MAKSHRLVGPFVTRTLGETRLCRLGTRPCRTWSRRTTRRWRPHARRRRKFRDFTIDDGDDKNMWTWQAIAALLRGHALLAAQKDVDAVTPALQSSLRNRIVNEALR